MNSQTKSFPEVIAQLEKVFDDVFGIRLLGLEKASEKASIWSSYIVVSKFKNNVNDSVSMRNQDDDAKRAILYLILSVVYMTSQSIDEGM